MAMVDWGNDVQMQVTDEPNPSAEDLLDSATRRIVEIDLEINNLKDNREMMEKQLHEARKRLLEKCEKAVAVCEKGPSEKPNSIPLH